MNAARASHKPQSLNAVLAAGIAFLAKSSDSPSVDAKALLAFAIGAQRAWQISHGDADVSNAQADEFFKLCAKRASGAPVAYLIGFAGFYGREFAVNEHVLIPRPETEHMVEEAIAFLRARTRSEPCAPQCFTVLDVGVGSGAIGVTIAAEILGAILDGTDTSLEALKVAKRNACRLGVGSRCKFHYGDLAGPVRSRTFDLVIANLPYVPTAQIGSPPDPVSFEPRAALNGGPDGMALYRRFLQIAPHLLRGDALLLMEAAPPTIAVLHELTTAAFPQAQVRIRLDYGRRARYVLVKTAARRAS